MNLKCLLGFHKWFWEHIDINFSQGSRVWSNLHVKVCTKCGKVKAFVEGKNDDGKFRAINGNKVQKYEYKNNF